MIDRERMTERVSPSLLRLELIRALRPLVVLAIGFGLAAAAGIYILDNINGGVGSTHTIRAAVADATGVVPERAEVRFEGIEAGLVQNVNLSGGHAVITATVATQFGPIYKNATLTVRPNTALQDMYIDVLNRGTPTAGLAGPGFVIPLSQTTSPVNVAELLDVFEPAVRAHLYGVLDQLGNGLANRGVYLRRAFVDLVPLLQIAGQVSAQLAVRSDLTKQLVHNAAILSEVLGRRSTQLHNVVLSGTKTLQALSTQGGVPLQQTLAELPRTLNDVQPYLSALDLLLPQLDLAITKLYPVAHRASSALANLRSFASAAEPALVALQAPVQRLVPLSQQLTPFSSELASSLQAIRPQTANVNHVTSEVAACPLVLYTFFNWSDSITKFYDAYGTYPVGDFGFGLESDPLFSGPQLIAGPTCAGGTTIGGVPTPGYPAYPGPSPLKAAWR